MKGQIKNYSILRKSKYGNEEHSIKVYLENIRTDDWRVVGLLQRLMLKVYCCVQDPENL